MGDADTANIQKLIKKVIEATRCSPSQAELALYDNDNNIFAAVEYILDKGVEIESWTEHKSKKDKKKEEDERKVTRGQQFSRGRGGAAADRGGRGRGGSTSTPRGGPTRGGGSSRGGRGQSSVPRPPQPGRSQPDAGVLKPVDLNEDSSEWKGGSMEFKRMDVATSAVPSSSTIPTSAGAPSISFAAVAAAAARREQQKNQPPPPVVQPTPVVETPRAPTPEPTPESVSNESVHDANSFTHEPSAASPHIEPMEETVPVNQDEIVNVSSVHTVQATSPQLQANVSWTTQLKSDLGIGGPQISADVSPVKPQSYHSSTLPGVEFATEAAPTGLVDYHFGFVEAPPVAPAPLVEPSPQPTELLFSNSRHSAAAVAPLKPSEMIGNTEYSGRTTSPVASLSQSRLGYGEPSTVSYSPAPTADSRNIPKPLGQMPNQQTQAYQQQQQQQQQPPQMFPSQMSFPYGANPYINMNMYSPVAATGMRPEDYTALLQYPFPGMDMTNLMGGGAFPQSSSTQSLSNQHRTDSHGMDNTIKYTSQTSREQSQQPAAVQPPPGFGNPFAAMQPQLNMLPQHYNPQQYPTHYMMPNIGAAGGRQMYSQDEERKSYDKLSAAKTQPTQAPAYHNGGHYGMNNSNKKQYNWNQ